MGGEPAGARPDPGAPARAAEDAGATRRPSRFSVWWVAARPKTLPAAAVPVLVGGATAWQAGAFALGPWLAALAGGLAIQVGTNFANDVFDYEQGADGENRLGPTRAVAAGMVSPRAMRWAMVLAFGAAVAVGVYLVARGGWVVVAIGLASVASGIFYTATRYSLAYLGLGDLFVLLFFGGVAVAGTHYVQALSVSPFVFAAAWPVGAWATNIIVVNNLRDRATDAAVGKRTLAVRLGRTFCVAEYAVLAASAYGVSAWAAWSEGAPWLALPWLTLPAAVLRIRQLAVLEGRALNPLLGGTAQMLLMFGVLWALAIAGTGPS